MHTLIAFASRWGSKLGGINCFNTDLLSAFGDAFHQSANTVCIVAEATDEEIQDALSHQVHLLPLPYPPSGNKFTKEQAPAAIAELENMQIPFDPEETVWLGHDLISGAAANEAAKIKGGRSALIHHMSYDHYESFAEDSATAYEKAQEQAMLFQEADQVLAVGPLLRDALEDRLGGSKEVTMLIPGLAEINTRPAPNTFTAFLSGRLSDDASKIKQGHLGIAAFAKAHHKAREADMPDGLQNQPKLILRGVDFESKQPPQASVPAVSP